MAQNDFTQEQKRLLSVCKYYKGEDTCPFTDNNRGMLWMCEMAFINSTATKEGKELLLDYLYDYTNAGLSMFKSEDSVPNALKALILNRYARGCFSLDVAVEGFKRLYTKYYG